MVASRASTARIVAVAAGLTAATAALVYAAGAAMLLAYPYEWDPSEGGVLEGAWRLLHDPGQLYPHGTVVPNPFPLPPLSALLHVPLVLAGGADLRGPRALSVLLLVATLGGIYVLVRKGGASRLLAIVAAAALLAPVGDSFWLTLARVDGLLIALVVWAAVVGLPAELRRGASVLSWRRALATAALLVAACLAKPSAALHGAPIVLAWLLVDGRSFVRLAAATLALGLAAVAALQLLTGGGFLDATRLWLAHGESLHQALGFARSWLWTHALLVAALVVITIVAWRRGGQPLRDSSWALLVGGAAAFVLLGKFGAWTSYLLLLVAAIGVVIGRLARRAGDETLALALLAVVILGGLARSSFPVPTAQDRATAAFVSNLVRARGAPVLVAKLESLYVAVGQDEEIEADGFPWLMHEHAPGIERIFERLAAERYRTVVVHPYALPVTAQHALAAHYAPIGVCEVGFWHDHYRYSIWVPRSEAAQVSFAPPDGTACSR